MKTLKVGAGNTKVGTKLDFDVMANPFGVRWLNEKQAIKMIKDAGFKIKREKQFDKTIYIKPIGDSDKVYNFIEKMRFSVFSISKS